MIKAFIHVMRVALRQLIMTSLAKQFTDLQILSIIKLEKLDVYFTNSLSQWPQRHCDKKGRAVGYCDVTIASGRFMVQWPAHVSMTSQ